MDPRQNTTNKGVIAKIFQTRELWVKLTLKPYVCGKIVHSLELWVVKELSPG
jgi:hypothetical protein